MEISKGLKEMINELNEFDKETLIKMYTCCAIREEIKIERIRELEKEIKNLKKVTRPYRQIGGTQ